MARQLSSQAQAAAQIRKAIKGMGIKVSVTSESFAGGNSVHIDVEDLDPKTHAKVTALCDQYQYGHFDGMTDYYDHSNRRDDIPQAKYVSVSNRFSDTVKQKAWDFVRAEYMNADEHPEVLADVPSNAQIAGEWVSQFMYRFMVNTNNDLTDAFWATQKPAKATQVKPKRHSTPVAVDSVTVRDGTRKGYSEIVFPAKPSDEARDELKAASFRWSPRNGVWWGKSDNLPAAYK